jgi:ATP-binding cassette subfamily B protein
VLAGIALLVAAGATLAIPAAFKQMIDLGFGAAAGQEHPPMSTPPSWRCSASPPCWRGHRRALLHRVLAGRARHRRHPQRRLPPRGDQSPEFFETTRTGEVLSRLTTDTTLIQAVVGTSISLALRNTLLFVGGLVMLFVTSAKLTSIILGLLVLTVVPIVLFGRRVRKLSRDSQDRIADASALAGEILNAMPTVQAFTHEKIEARASALGRRRLRDRHAAHPRARAADHAGHRAGVRHHRLRAVAGRARRAVRRP